MEIEVLITNEPIAEPPRAALHSGTTGVWAEFRGLVRGEENGQPIAALEYEAYVPMAEREIRRILNELSEKHSCLTVRVVHRIGIVPVGEAAVYIGVAAKHRAEVFAMLSDFVNCLKQDVPIWKRRPVSGDSGTGVPPVRSEASRNLNAAQTGPSHPANADEVLALLRAKCRVLEAERVALTTACGRVLRETVCAPEDQPPFDRSSVDGYAVRLDDASKQFRIVGEIRAGDWRPRQLQAAEAVCIATGGALPGDGLQVVMREDVERKGDVVSIIRRDASRNIRFRGEDARAGETLVEVGTVLQPGTVGLLASIGCSHPLVTGLPRVLHIATGNEIVPPDQVPERGQIRDSNSTLVRAFLAQWNIQPTQARVPEDEAAAKAAMANGQRPKAEVDLLLISGGASVGEHDFTRRLLEESGFTIHVSKTTARPGKPLIVAQRGNTIAFGLPGNPLAHFVCLNLYVRSALAAFTGQSAAPLFQRGVLVVDWDADGNGRETFWPARWTFCDGAASLMPLRWSSSGDLTSLATANALIRVSAGQSQLKRNSTVDFVSTEGST